MNLELAAKNVENVIKMANQIKALKLMLRKHKYLVGYCRECGNHRADGCRPECQLNQLLEE